MHLSGGRVDKEGKNPEGKEHDDVHRRVFPVWAVGGIEEGDPGDLPAGRKGRVKIEVERPEGCIKKEHRVAEERNVNPFS